MDTEENKKRGGMRLSNQTELAETIFRTLEIPPDIPFRCKGVNDTWYKLTKDCVPMWDAKTDQIDWFEDWVVLNHLLEGVLVPDWNKERIDNLERAIEIIEKVKKSSIKDKTFAPPGCHGNLQSAISSLDAYLSILQSRKE